jgi:hypothetical protein
MEFLISLSSLPDFEIIVWSWRTGEKLISQKTGANSENQILRWLKTGVSKFIMINLQEPDSGVDVTEMSFIFLVFLFDIKLQPFN